MAVKVFSFTNSGRLMIYLPHFRLSQRVFSEGDFMHRTVATTRAVVLALALCAVTFPAAAQVDTGSISGSITDPNGAMVPGAIIEAKENNTGRTYNTASTEAGLYALPSVAVGTYTIAVEHPGFKKNI